LDATVKKSKSDCWNCGAHSSVYDGYSLLGYGVVCIGK